MSAACVREHCDPRSYVQKLYRVGRQLVSQRIGGLPSGVRHFIGISPLSAGIIAKYLEPDAVMHFVSNPVEVERGPAADVSKNAPFLFVGRLSKEKGADVFLEAAKRARVKSIVVGDGSEREELEQRYPGASFIGWASHAKVLEYMRAARALVMSSQWYEPYGLVALEAAAVGVPAIVPRESGVSSRITHEVSGLHFRLGDVDELSRQITKLLNPSLAAEYGRTAYKRYWTSPSTMARHVAALADVYSSVLPDSAFNEEVRVLARA